MKPHQDMSTHCRLTLRTITDYTALGTFFLETKATLLKVEFQRFKERNGKSFVEQSIRICHWWQQLSTKLQYEILQLPFANISRSGLVGLTKIAPEHLHQWCEQINLLVQDRGYLKPSDMASLAKSLIPKVKRHLKLGEPIEDGDFLLVAKKYRFSPEQLAQFQDECQLLADTLTTAHLLQIIEQRKLDPLKLLATGDRQDYLLFKKDQEIQQLLLQLIEALKHSEKKAPREENHHHEAVSLDDDVRENHYYEAVSLDDDFRENHYHEAVSLDDDVRENHYHEAVFLDDDMLEKKHHEAVSLDDDVLEKKHHEAVFLDNDVLDKHHHEAVFLDNDMLEKHHHKAISLDDNVLEKKHHEAISLDDNVLENDNTPSIQEQKLDTGRNGDEKIPEHPAQYIKNAEVGILKEGVIVERGRMIGQLGEKVRVLCQKDGNKLFELTDLVLLSVHKPKKKKRNTIAEIKSLSSV
ncbi:hypothetical protein VB715_21785 [Crocosphaera sp. UHCC 0190]|uniref:hypothetical protein n=1 Tax=Crocosphaera sp. UHCC 0190 TaxID=3110246 RepID=UPI002B1FE942|nr:hypothetical protein [Crocosphaera sp. UHCC 0190]MEA5512405.1 hypothetical protein [Crocosphaera sp. UHCC 0190]